MREVKRENYQHWEKEEELKEERERESLISIERKEEWNKWWAKNEWMRKK